MHPPSDLEVASTGSAVVVPDERRPRLDEVESAAWSSLMQVLHLLPQQLDRQLRDTAGVPHSYYMILSALSDAPDRELAHSALAQAVGSSSSRVSRAVDALCGRNWLERRRCEQDRRVHYARLTDDGARVLAHMTPGHLAEVRRTVLDRLSRAELVLLQHLAAQIAEPLSADLAMSEAPS
jgi:DNA-binding MarR family transcriptional regulator